MNATAVWNEVGECYEIGYGDKVIVSAKGDYWTFADTGVHVVGGWFDKVQITYRGGSRDGQVSKNRPHNDGISTC